MKLYQILIGIVIVSLVSTGMMIFISDAGAQYNPNKFNESNLGTYNSMNELNSIMNTYEDNSSNVDPDSTDDKLGSLFTSTYQSVQTVKGSTKIMGDMVNESIGNNDLLGGFGSTLSTGLKLIIGISIVIGIFLAFITKSNRT